jgi:hypothetical protein
VLFDVFSPVLDNEEQRAVARELLMGTTTTTTNTELTSKIRQMDTTQTVRLAILISQGRHAKLGDDSVNALLLAYAPMSTLFDGEEVDNVGDFEEYDGGVDTDLSIDLLEHRVEFITNRCFQEAQLYGLQDGFEKAWLRKLDQLDCLTINNPMLNIQWDIIPLWRYLNAISRVRIMELEEMSYTDLWMFIIDTTKSQGITKMDSCLKPFVDNRVIAMDMDLLYWNQLIQWLEPNDKLIQTVKERFESYECPTREILASMGATIGSINELEELEWIIKSVLVYPLPYDKLSDLLMDSDAQWKLYTHIIETSTIHTIQQIINNWDNLKHIFPDIPSDNEIIIKKLLSLRLYDQLQDMTIGKDLVINHFWDCFKLATNGSSSRGELSNCLQSLKLLHDDEEVKRLREFIDSVDELFKFKVFIERGKPMRPADLSNISMDSLAQRVLELNEDAYKQPDKLYSIILNLSRALNCRVPSREDVQCHCIDSSLVQNDFKFAYSLTTQLMTITDDEYKQEKWLTWFQVSKYISPSWLDTETPVNIIQKQMSLLSEILVICPIKEAQVVITQWRAMEMELSIRDDEKLDLSDRFKKALSSSASEFLDGKLLNWISG